MVLSSTRTSLLAPIFGAAIAVLALASTHARAQGISSNADEPQAGEVTKGESHVVTINEVERGFYLGVDYGPNYFIPIDQPGFVAMNKDYASPGTRMGVRAGYDVLNNIQIDAFLIANFNEASTIDGNQVSHGILNGDLTSFAPGIGARFDFVTSEDQRFFAFGRAGVGYAFWFPQQLAVDTAHPCDQTNKTAYAACGAGGSVHTDASIGVEYYTKLRHLSVGLEVDVQALLLPFAFGIEAYPTLKYTF